jgi:hypothetical protein
VCAFSVRGETAPVRFPPQTNHCFPSAVSWEFHVSVLAPSGCGYFAGVRSRVTLKTNMSTVTRDNKSFSFGGKGWLRFLGRPGVILVFHMFPAKGDFSALF